MNSRHIVIKYILMISVLLLTILSCNVTEINAPAFADKTISFKECEFQWAISSHVIDEVNDVIQSEADIPDRYFVLETGSNRGGFRVEYYGVFSDDALLVSGVHSTGEVEVAYKKVGVHLADEVFNKLRYLDVKTNKIGHGGLYHSDCSVLKLYFNNQTYKFNYINESLLDRDGEDMYFLKLLDDVKLLFNNNR